MVWGMYTCLIADTIKPQQPGAISALSLECFEKEGRLPVAKRV